MNRNWWLVFFFASFGVVVFSHIGFYAAIAIGAFGWLSLFQWLKERKS